MMMSETVKPCTHVVDEFNLCVYRCAASVKALLSMNETMCERCDEVEARFYNEDRCEALCEACHKFYEKHNCTGDHCYCIGGDENLDR